MQRAEQLRQAVVKWNQLGGFVAMQTLTARHSVKMPLAEVGDRMQAARRALGKDTSYRNARRRFGIFGGVTVCEVTRGAAGWHVHFHELLFVEQPAGAVTAYDLWQFEQIARSAWMRCVTAQGLDALPNVAYDLREGDNEVYAYIAKYGHSPIKGDWTLDREIAGAPVKTAKRQGLTPWQLLDAAQAGDEQAARHWQEFASWSHGRKQMAWGRNLLKRLEIEDSTDEQLAAQEVGESTGAGVVGLIERSDYAWLAYHRPLAEVELIELGAAQGLDAIRQYLRACGVKLRSPDELPELRRPAEV